MSEKKFNTLLTGLILALVLPALTLLVFWLIKSDRGFVDFLVYFQEMKMPFYMDQAEFFGQGGYFCHLLAGICNVDTQNCMKEV